ncbi:acyl transferase/acyl hydrolase/lysophospholipase [Aspergillus undulatus]|uniref:acyl transferase/acyl hydrolase/lysophospholipase n=1 Tax=Aspergillus undulatus TaxID=1810928 RepID=UPI003CCCE713
MIAIVAADLQVFKAAVTGPVKYTTQPLVAGLPRLGFTFTGQGAQWYAMGRGLSERYFVFLQALEDAARHLQSLGASWRLEEELSRDRESSRVDDASLSFGLTVIIQLSFVRLLSSWEVEAAAITGNSSGEIAAAYAAGALSFK